MSNNTRKIIISLIIFIFLLLTAGNTVLALTSKVNEVDSSSLAIKGAIMLSLNEFQEYYGNLPDKFELTVDSKSDLIDISFIHVPYKEGGSLKIIINRKTGKVVDKIVGQ